ncbi:hypothetical protein L3V77_15735 [Vibrio sp. DW001]|uniref:hypothetical protein n=1 Tax=Vibrio sp. DW001 TaxID=2912315 RepID=UPI0023B1939F|nr:hypothetical protein [Vibrio sp. DW001]WED26428.1 hypothetical protein L3V77_15735 [Vibrio sp. DW001]
MVTISIDINTFEEALNLQNVASIRHNALLKGNADSVSTSQALISLMWKQIYVEAGAAMERLQADQEGDPDYLD